ncbi:hypothetical protein MBLNU230_g6505t1 [Neophaeotheca triangularis]
MFKKKPTIKPAAPLRSSDRRKLADRIIQEYQLKDSAPDGQTPEEKAESTNAHTQLRNSLLPDNIQSARFTTTHGPELKQVSGTVYVGHHDDEEARILWFEIEKAIYPSVYTLWRNSDLVPLLHTPNIVVEKLKGGADLMTPGLAGGPPFPKMAKKGRVVAIAGTDKPSVPIAIGLCDLDVSTLQNVAGVRGRAVENMHWAGDELWSYSTNARPGQAPPAEIEGWTKVLQTRGLVEKTGDMSLDNDGDEDGGVALANGDNIEIAEQQQLLPRNEHVPGEDAPSNDANTNTPSKKLSVKEIDDAFRNAFLYAIHQHKVSNPSQANYGFDFPVHQTQVMATMIQPFLPAFNTDEKQQLQIKNTSWKNIKKFVKAMDKERIIKSKEKDRNETVILDIDFDDQAVRDFKPYRLPKKETAGGAALGRGEKATEQVGTGDGSVGQKLQVVVYYRPTAKLQPLFTGAEATGNMFTASEVRPTVTKYIEANQLISESNKRQVKLDPTLANAVFDGSTKLDKEVIAKGMVPRDALMDRVLKGMSESYAILRNEDDLSNVKARSGAPPKIHITLETRSGNKTVTKVSGLEAYYIQPRPLADELRKLCAGSTSVEPLAGGAKKNEKPVEEVMVQGPQKDAVVKALGRRGVNPRWVEVQDKTKGKKK